MTKPVQPTKQQQPKPLMRTWYVELILGSVALAIVYLSGSLAIDTGSLIAYAVAVVFLVMAVRHFYNAGRAYSKGRANDQDQ